MATMGDYLVRVGAEDAGGSLNTVVALLQSLDKNVSTIAKNMRQFDNATRQASQTANASSSAWRNLGNAFSVIGNGIKRAASGILSFNKHASSTKQHANGFNQIAQSIKASVAQVFKFNFAMQAATKLHSILQQGFSNMWKSLVKTDKTLQSFTKYVKKESTQVFKDLGTAIGRNLSQPIKTFGKWWKANKKQINKNLATVIQNLSRYMANFARGLGAIMKQGTKLFDWFKNLPTSIKAATSSVLALWAVMKSGPVGQLMALVTLAGQLVEDYDIYKENKREGRIEESDDYRNVALKGLWDLIDDDSKSGIQKASAIGQKIGSALSTAFEDAINHLGEWVSGDGKGVVEGIGSAINAGLITGLDFINSIVTSITDSDTDNSGEGSIGYKLGGIIKEGLTAFFGTFDLTSILIKTTDAAGNIVSLFTSIIQDIRNVITGVTEDSNLADAFAVFGTVIAGVLFGPGGALVVGLANWLATLSQTDDGKAALEQFGKSIGKFIVESLGLVADIASQIITALFGGDPATAGNEAGTTFGEALVEGIRAALKGLNEELSRGFDYWMLDTFGFSSHGNTKEDIDSYYSAKSKGSFVNDNGQYFIPDGNEGILDVTDYTPQQKEAAIEQANANGYTATNSAAWVANQAINSSPLQDQNGYTYREGYGAKLGFFDNFSPVGFAVNRIQNKISGRLTDPTLQSAEEANYLIQILSNFASLTENGFNAQALSQYISTLPYQLQGGIFSGQFNYNGEKTETISSGQEVVDSLVKQIYDGFMQAADYFENGQYKDYYDDDGQVGYDEFSDTQKQEAVTRALDQVVEKAGGNAEATKKAADLFVKSGGYMETLPQKVYELFKDYISKLGVNTDGSETPDGTSQSQGGFISSPGRHLLGEDGEEVVIPLSKPSRAASLMTQAISKLGGKAKDAVTNALGLDGGLDTIGGALASGGSVGAGSNVFNITNNNNVSAPVTITVNASGADGKLIGNEIYSSASRNLIRTLQSVYGG